MKPYTKSDKKRKFGTANPRMKTLCKECGKSYGEHLGIECPAE